MSKEEHYRSRLARQRAASLSGAEPTHSKGKEKPMPDAIVDLGWGRLIFAHTFRDNRRLADALLAELPGKRDIAFYVNDPHVLLAMEPQSLFLDPLLAAWLPAAMFGSIGLLIFESRRQPRARSRN